MAVTRASFLKEWRFTADPFGTTNAEQERGQIAGYFVRAPWFDRLVGDPEQPESLILFAPRGYGKTSHRIEAARWASQRRDPPALTVEFDDVDLLLPPNQVGLNEYVAVVRRKALEALDGALRHQRARETRFRRSPHYHRFIALLSSFAPLRALDYPATPEAERLSGAYRQTTLSAREWLRELSDLARAAEFASIYVLIDGVDEHSAVRNAPERAADLLSPLLDAPGLLQECNVAFKFFLPDFLQDPLRRGAFGRFDRIPVLSLEWTDERLAEILAQRLASMSLVSPTTSAVRSFGDLCEPGVDADRWLVHAALGSPRDLLRHASAVIDAHCARAADVEQPIAAATLAATLGPMPAPAPGQADTSGADVRAEIPLLRYDIKRGDIWVGSQRRTAEPLTRYERLCMEHLWRRRNETVTYGDLERIVYGVTPDVRGSRANPRASLAKIVMRLREVIGPEEATAQTYLTVQKGVGYLLRHCSEADGDGRTLSS